MTSEFSTPTADRPPTSAPPRDIADIERLILSMAGTALVVHGLKRREWTGFATAALGGAFVYMGVTGRNALYRSVGIRLIRTVDGTQRIEIRKTLTINRPIGELFAFWRDLRNLPTIMSHLESVDVLTDRRSHWKAKAPGGLFVEWDADIVNEKPNTLIAWESCEGAAIANWGAVYFTQAPPHRGTEITVELEYEPIGGATGAAIAKLFGEEPAQQVEDDLRRFKQVMETGEVATTLGQPRGGQPWHSGNM
jgi:uncharacterized membrane protein